ncbi:MAG: hypothetical protein RL172_1434, partial [Bacteroidota bacterium]
MPNNILSRRFAPVRVPAITSLALVILLQVMCIST